MRSRILPLIALFFFSLYVLSTPVVWVVYYAYQDYIAENFCVNKKNPDCCGKCFVNDVTDEEPKKELPKIEVRTPEIASFILQEQHDRTAAPVERTRFAHHRTLPVSTGYTSTPFQPPEHTAHIA